jgi:hypothetical protein
MDSILYLTYSDIAERNGLVFPNELNEGTYAPGIWFVALSQNECLPDVLEFDAVYKNELQTLKMRRVDNYIYQVDTKLFGEFSFRVINTKIRNQKYIGKSTLINDNIKLYQIKPIEKDIQRLNNACLDKGFFFVGKIDLNL